VIEAAPRNRPYARSVRPDFPNDRPIWLSGFLSISFQNKITRVIVTTF
jgi:hypothetical protein